MNFSTYFLEEDLIKNTTLNDPSTLPLHLNEIQNLSDCFYHRTPDFTDFPDIDMTKFTDDTWIGYEAPSSKTIDQDMLNTPHLTPGSCNSATQPILDEFEEFLAPLLSPAIPPDFSETFELHNPPLDHNFSSSSSFTLTHGSQSEEQSVLHSPFLLGGSVPLDWNDQMIVSPMTMLSKTTPQQSTTPPRKLSLRQQAVLLSLPATPASVMNIGIKPLTQKNTTTTTTTSIKHTRKKTKLVPAKIVPLKPLISPYPQPSISSNNNNYMLQNNSMYPPENKHGHAPMSGVESRRSAHKVAEQRRRDVLKQSFDSLRNEITDILVADSTIESRSEEELRQEKEKEVQQMSKVLLLQHSYEYILKLKRDSLHKDNKIETMELEIIELRRKMSS